MTDLNAISRLPGSEIILPGFEDLAAGRLTVAACLVSIARPIVEASGLVEAFAPLRYIPEPERALYQLLCQGQSDAYSRYNSLLRRLVSFERALRQSLLRPSSAA
jgi:hypothetical protein